MRALAAIVTLVGVTTPVQAQSNEIDLRAMTTKYHFVVFSPSVGATLKLGAVADLSGDKFVANNAMQLTHKNGELVAISQATSAVATRETTVSAYQELAISVEASLSFFGSGKFNMSKQEAERFRENTLYARLAVIDGVQELEQVSWPVEWALRAGTDPSEKIKDFVRTYGTHYVSKLYYGRSVAIKATLRETEQSKKDALEAKLRAKFLAFSLDGDFTNTAKSETKDYRFDLFIAISGGKSDKPERLLIRSFDELDVFVKDLQAGRFKFDSTPVAADFLSLSGLTKDEQIDRTLRGDVKFTDIKLIEDTIAKQIEAAASKLPIILIKRVDVAATTTDKPEAAGKPKAEPFTTDFADVAKGRKVVSAEALVVTSDLTFDNKDDHEILQLYSTAKVTKFAGAKVSGEYHALMRNGNERRGVGKVQVLVIATLVP